MMTKLLDCIDEKKISELNAEPTTGSAKLAEATDLGAGAAVEKTESTTIASVEETSALKPIEAQPSPEAAVEAVSSSPAAIEAAIAPPSEIKNAEKVEDATPIAASVAIVTAIVAAGSAVNPETTSKPTIASDKSVIALRPEKREITKPTAVDRIQTFSETHGFKAAGLALALGMGWLLGVNTFENEAAAKRVVAAIETLDAKVESVAAQAAARDDIAALQSSVEKSRTGLDATRNNAAAAVAQLTNKFDRAEREHAARFEKLEKEFTTRLERMTERLDRAERAATAHSPTAAISQLPPPSAPAPVTLPTRALGPRTEETRVPQNGAEARNGADRSRIPANGYVLREVRDGAALVEGRAGMLEVIPGDVLPGVGRVRAITRRGKQWVVVTSGGVIDSTGY